MKRYQSDGRKILDVEFDERPQVSDFFNGMPIMSVHEKSADEYALFVLEPDATVGVYVLDEIFIVGHVPGFETLNDAVLAWMREEI
jgi:hypothetical protein